MARVINLRGIPDNLFRKFKSKCAMNDVGMSETLIELMSFYTADENREIAPDETTRSSNIQLLGRRTDVKE